MGEPNDSVSRDLEREADALHDLLVHLYDYEYLREHDLLTWLPLGGASGGEGRMGQARATVLAALEELGPPERGRFRATASRSYSVLNLHYVEGLTVQEVALELAISERQVYRDLKKAERDLAALLLERGAPSSDGKESWAELLDREMERAAESACQVTVCELLEGARSAVAKLAVEHGVQLVVSAEDAAVRTQRVLVRQTLLTLLSHVIETAREQSTLRVSGCVVGEHLVLAVTFTRGGACPWPYRLPQTGEHLVARLGGSWECSEGDEGLVTVTLRLGRAARASLLVVDDHQGLVELFRRYLWGELYDVYEATSGEAGVRLAEELQPDLIILDVMMPDQDGWEVLQRLQSRPTTREIPVIVCSVLDQPNLAYSLGAVDYIGKPVRREQLLQVLQRHRWGSSPGSRRGEPVDSSAPPKDGAPCDAQA